MHTDYLKPIFPNQSMPVILQTKISPTRFRTVAAAAAAIATAAIKANAKISNYIFTGASTWESCYLSIFILKFITFHRIETKFSTVQHMFIVCCL